MLTSHPAVSSASAELSRSKSKILPASPFLQLRPRVCDGFAGHNYFKAHSCISPRRFPCKKHLQLVHERFQGGIGHRGSHSTLGLHSDTDDPLCLQWVYNAMTGVITPQWVNTDACASSSPFCARRLHLTDELMISYTRDIDFVPP
jgi:hypothetical protein